MILTKEQTAEILPQKTPFVMVDNLVTASLEGFTSIFEVQEDNIFFINGKLLEPALIENIAQTVAAGYGYISQQEGGDPKIGFIGSIAKLQIHGLPVIGDEISTTVKQQYNFENIYLIKGENYANGKLLVECEMKIVVQE